MIIVSISWITNNSAEGLNDYMMVAKVFNIISRMIIVVIGLIVIALGVGMYIKSGFGLDAFSVFYQGVSEVIHVTLGRALQICLALLIITAFFIDRKVLGIGTLMHAFLLGAFIDLIKIPLPAPQSSAIAGVYLIAGVLLEGIGMGIYISTGLGAGAVDAFMLILYKRIKKSLKWARIGVDCLLAVSGFFLGGSLGIGTVAGVVCIGPVIEFTLKILKSSVIKHKLDEVKS